MYVHTYVYILITVWQSSEEHNYFEDHSNKMWTDVNISSYKLLHGINGYIHVKWSGTGLNKT